MSLVFVTTELDPITPGGAGTLVAALAERLAAAGEEVVVLLVGVPDAPAALGDVRVVAVEAPEGFEARSAAAAEAVARLPEVGRVEFQDFEGLGFTALVERERLGLGDVPITVRFHGPGHLLLEAAEIVPTGELARAGIMEAESLRMADAVVVPSRGLADLVATRYGVERHRILEGPPIVPELHGTVGPRGPTPEIVAYGRLAEAKGSGDLLAAAVPLLRSRPELRLRFVGYDGWSIAEDRPMREVLAERVPPDLADRVSFEPSPGRDRLAAALSGAWVAVVPSRFESFCIAAHEVRRLGLPLVVPDLPAFEPYFDEATGAVRYDGSVAGLTGILEALFADPERLDRLASAPPPSVGDPLTPYRALPSVRPPEARSALAVAATGRLESFEDDVYTSRPLRRVAAGLLRLLPDPVARLAVRVVPRPLKERFRSVADWRVEAARRELERRRRRVRERIAAGEFPELAAPATTVVIPCFDQGATLEEAILSVFEQTDPSFEIVVVDDGSTDPETRSILERLDWPRTRVLRQDNRGLPAARNAGVAAARGRYVVPLDADDALEPDFLATLRSALEAAPDAAYAHCNGRYFGAFEAYWITRPYNPYQLLVSNSVLGCVLLRRAAWEAVGGYDETMRHGNEDWELWLRLLEAGWGQVKVDAPLFRYRQSGRSMSVETLGRFETARLGLVERLPRLYGRARELKREWYPWVSVIVLPDEVDAVWAQTVDDAELVVVGTAAGEVVGRCRDRGWGLRTASDLSGAVGAAAGKFVVEWGALEAPGPAALAELAAALEADPEAATAGEGAPAMWRRWVLLDPEAPARRHRPVPGVRARGSRLGRGMRPTAGWSVPPSLPEPELRVIRQPPEVEGRLPPWIAEAVSGTDDPGPPRSPRP
ncbi:MAG TPA: glycosyltransferase [Actinobacteria bacterium]|nr:glycosyltransferase [Actinomycetota bacterium]